eukprot:TRINITY_DN12066_c0_g1_i1.p1 TRINITY_DN12066_c0_g1~~TRINITY_DN12066_c0_g1_i1.p1  ORF type:complete len:361 (-),score=66.82 TRINITY_DN12066_c0_g1_i1:138-1220(-)
MFGPQDEVNTHLAECSLESSELRNEAVQSLFKERGLLGRFLASRLEPLPCRRWTKVHPAGNIASWRPLTARRIGAAAEGSSSRASNQQGTDGGGDVAFLSAASISLNDSRLFGSRRPNQDGRIGEEESEDEVPARRAGRRGGKGNTFSRGGAEQTRGQLSTALGDAPSDEELVAFPGQRRPQTMAPAAPRRPWAEEEEKLWAQFDLQARTAAAAATGGVCLIDDEDESKGPGDAKKEREDPRESTAIVPVSDGLGGSVTGLTTPVRSQRRTLTAAQARDVAVETGPKRPLRDVVSPETSAEADGFSAPECGAPRQIRRLDNGQGSAQIGENKTSMLDRWVTFSDQVGDPHDSPLPMKDLN